MKFNSFIAHKVNITCRDKLIYDSCFEMISFNFRKSNVFSKLN